MGDYTKLIVNCRVRATTEEVKEALENCGISLVTSAYHCGGEVLQIQRPEWSRELSTEVTIVTQCRYSKGIPEFLEWLKPLVADGFGPAEIYAIVQTEYVDSPTIHSLYEIEKEYK